MVNNSTNIITNTKLHGHKKATTYDGGNPNPVLGHIQHCCITSNVRVYIVVQYNAFTFVKK